jgi:hypothetical protein
VQDKGLAEAAAAFGRGAGDLASNAASIVTAAQHTKNICDGIALVGGITSLTDLAVEEGVTVACQRMAQVAAETAAFAVADQYLVDPLASALGVDPQAIRIGLVAYQTFSLVRGVCFPAGTLVATEHGHVPIEQIEPGAKVWSYDAERQEWKLCEVLRRLERQYDGEMVTITIGDEEITATAEHPFWVIEGVGLRERPLVSGLPPRIPDKDNGQWVTARNLRQFDRLLSLNRGADAEVTAVGVKGASCTVYNLTVAVSHVYTVGTASVLVHNVCQPTGEELPNGVTDRGANLGNQQGREFRTDQLGAYEFDPSQPSYVRGWLQNERRRIDLGQATEPRTPPGYVQAHGRITPAREGYDYSNSRLQGADLNTLEESTRRAYGAGGAGS